MAKISIERNGSVFGPYSESQIQYYIEQNKVFLNDIARVDSSPSTTTLLKAMKLCSWKIPRTKSLWASFKKLGVDVIFPIREITSMSWLQERRFLLLATMGLLPLLILFITGGVITYIAIAIYFSALWGMVLFSFFKTPEVNLKTCCACYLSTAIFSTTILIMIHATGVLNAVKIWEDSPWFCLRFLGMFIVAGFPEEICKALIIFLLVRRKGVICVPQTIVLYGLFSGLGFGINEGVCYQLGVNRTQGVDTAYFLNVLRLTALPLLHAIWCGISSYFIAFSALFPLHRGGLLGIGILVPAILHALYNAVIGWGCLVPATIGIILLTIYLTNARIIKQKLM